MSAAVLAGVGTVVGVPLGWVWEQLVPPVHVRVTDSAAGDGGVVPMLNESAHQFDALAVFMLCGFAAGVFTAAAGWMLSRHRGLVSLFSIVLGSAAAAVLAIVFGEFLAARHYADALEAARAGTIAALPPQIESWWVVVTPPFGAALTYGVLSSWSVPE